MTIKRADGGWVVCERGDKIYYLSPRYRTKENAEKQRDLMSSRPENKGRRLNVTFRESEPARKPPRRKTGRRQPRR
jgi:hypothetical protein